MAVDRLSPVLSIHEPAPQFNKHALNLAEIRLYAYDVFYNKRLSPALERRYRVEGLPLDDVRYTAARDKAFRECRPAQMTPAAFVAHVLSGAAWTPGYFSGETYGSGRYFRRRNKDWRASQFLALDFDDNVSVADCLRYDLVSQYALLVHPSASSKPTHYKTRVIFLLDEPMMGDVETWKRAQRALIAQFEQAADPQSIVASQPYFGSTNTVEPPHVNLSARLPLTIALEWAAEVAQQDAQKEAERRARRDAVKRVALTGSRAEKYAQAAVDRIISDMTGAAKGTHHAALVKTAAQLASMAAGGWPVGEWEAKLKKAAAPRAADSEIRNAIKWAIEGAEPRPLELPTRQHRSTRTRQDAPKQPYRIRHPHKPLKCAHVVNERYITLSDDDRHKVICVRSDVGTGKTRAALELAKTYGSVLYLSHREKLAESFTEAANRAGVTFEHYKGLKRDDMRRVPRHATCINTYSTLDDGGLPTADLVIIDEMMQMLGHVASGDTFTGNGAFRAYQALEYAVKACGRVLILDAHLDDVALDLIRGWAGADNVLVIDNAHQTDRGQLVMYESEDAAMSAGLALLTQPGEPVAFAYASKEKAIAATEEIAAAVGRENVLLLHRDNAGGERQRAYLLDPDGETEHYRAIVYSPVIGTGVDINAPVRAVVVIGGAHLDAYDIRQMAGRFRKAPVIHAYVPDVQGALETRQDVIFEMECDKSAQTRTILDAAGRRVRDESAKELQFLRLFARMKARSNRSKNALRRHFLRLSTGYTVEIIEGNANEALRANLQAFRQQREETLKALALTADPVTREEYKRAADAGEVYDELAAGWRRHEIENVSGVDINAPVRDQLWSAGSRRTLRNTIDLLDARSELKTFDAEQVANQVPVHQRAHRTVKRDVRVEFVNALVSGEIAIERNAQQMAAAFSPLIKKYARELRLHFGWRPDRCERVPSIVRRVLRSVGMALDSYKRRVDGELTRFYRLDAGQASAWLELARSGLDARQARRADEQPAELFQNCQRTALRLSGNSGTAAANGVNTPYSSAYTELYPPDLAGERATV